MITLFLGGASSGKSELAERFALFDAVGTVFYIATLRDEDDDENRARIHRHRARRVDTPFVTRVMTEPCDLKPYADEMRDGMILLDCLGVMTANTKYAYENGLFRERDNDEAYALLVRYLDDLERLAGRLTVVSPDIFRDDLSGGSRDYAALLARVHTHLVCERGADLIEAVAGCAVPHRVTQPQLAAFLKELTLP